MTAANGARKATVRRETKETAISLDLCLDGAGQARIDTGFGMADHMLTLMAFWAGFDLTLECRGDLHVDAHHTVEDVALCLGQALDKALGDRKGIARTACARVPMDEALADVCVDLSGRSYLVFRGQKLLPPVVAGEESDLWREFFKSLAGGAKMNLHITLEYGINGHHLLESACKGLGLALKGAVALSRDCLLSTKGSFD
ncbi:MAG: imidazoleglycerol-phosphate dehydratase [Desulfovibrio sp.]|jgi:imidazoleglycerol-phosphate dehydratase|nr:imidazoleglycerol-phosphate dehydratase [Desulfovibrio sp.]